MDEVVEALTSKLEWPRFDREIVEFIARDRGIMSQFVDTLDEGCRRAMDEWRSSSFHSRTSVRN